MGGPGPAPAAAPHARRRAPAPPPGEPGPPLLVVVEDLHWLDGETQAVLDSLVENLPAARLLLLVNYRPEYRHACGGKRLPAF